MRNIKFPANIKVLSLDGGGIKGIYSTIIIEEIEKVTKKPISQIFDFICGTSIGGLTAIALALEIPAKEITKIFMSFSDSSQLNNTDNFFLSEYKNRIKEIFGLSTIKDIKHNFITTAYSITHQKEILFNNCINNNYLELSLYDLAMAITAEPRYLPTYYINKIDESFIDGGLWAYNPSWVTMNEILEIYTSHNKLFHTFNILSVGSGIVNDLEKNIKEMDKFDYLFNSSILGQLNLNNLLDNKILNMDDRINYIRISQENINSEFPSIVDTESYTLSNLINDAKQKASELVKNGIIDKILR